MTGGVVAADGPMRVLALRRLVEAVACRCVGARGEAGPHRPVRRGPDAPATPIAFDTQIAAYLLNAPCVRQKIADVVAERLDLILPPAAAGLPPTAVAGLEALAALAVRPGLELALRDEGVERLFAEIELPLIPILARMEAVGVALDRDALAQLEREFAAEIERLEREIYAAVGHQFTIGSPKQLGEILFEELRLPKGRKTKTGYSTDATVLEELRGVHPVIAPVLDWRIYTKLRWTYVERAAQADRPATGGCTRPSTRPWRRPADSPRPTRTCRTSPSGPTSGRRIRRAFVAGAGGRADGGRLQPDRAAGPRPRLRRAAPDGRVPRGEDIHRGTAAGCSRSPADGHAATSARCAKMVNFGVAYGMSGFGPGARAGIGARGGAGVHHELLRAYPASARTWSTSANGRGRGCVSTLLGRRRRIPELSSPTGSCARHGERMANNMPIQGTAADIMKIAMIRADLALREGASGLGCSSLSTTSCWWRRRATRWSGWSPCCARRWRARCRCRWH